MIMFKPVRILQVGSIALFLAGCAANKTAALPQTPLASAPAATNTSPVVAQPVRPLPADADSIQAGSSLAGNTRYVQADGRLIPSIQAYADEVAQRRGIPLAHVQALLKDRKSTRLNSSH